MPLDDRFKIIADPAILGSGRRPGRAIVPAVRFIVAHDTGNPGASARAHARFYRNDPDPPPSIVSSAHLFVDDGEIIETIPAFAKAEQALHVLRNRPTDNVLFGVDANRAAIGVEYCFGGSIDADFAYERFVWTIAALCDVHKLDPSRDVVGHEILDPGRKTDPGQSLRRSGRSYEGLLKDVVTEFKKSGGDATQIVRASGALAGKTVKATVRLMRREAPRRAAKPKGEVIEPGTRLTVKQVVNGEVVSGNDDWCELTDGGFCWSGGVTPV